MTKGRRITKGAVRALAVAAGLVVALALPQTSAATVFTDPAGDSGAAPDVTSLTVTNDARGRVAFRLTVANRPNGLEASETAHDLVYVFLNTDRNGATGDPDGDDYVIQVAADRFGLSSWQRSGYTALATTGARATRSGGTLTLTIASRDLRRPRAFDISVVSVRIAGAALQSGETGPDTGRWTYTLARFCVPPDVRGRTLAAARRALRAADCAVGRITRRARRGPAGRVVAQSPRAGTARPRGARVNLVVSRGSRP